MKNYSVAVMLAGKNRSITVPRLHGSIRTVRVEHAAEHKMVRRMTAEINLMLIVMLDARTPFFILNSEF